MNNPSFGRLESQIKQKIAVIIQRDLTDPRLGFLTVTRVKLTRDKHYCKVYYSVLGSAGDRSKAAHALEDARGHIQSLLGRTLHTRTLPILQFQFDESIEGAIRVSSILDDLARDRGDDVESDVEGDSEAVNNDGEALDADSKAVEADSAKELAEGETETTSEHDSTASSSDDDTR